MIVIAEVVRAHHEVTKALILGQSDGQWWIVLALFEAALQTQAHCVGMRYPARASAMAASNSTAP